MKPSQGAGVQAWVKLAALAGCLLACEGGRECHPPAGIAEQPLISGSVEVSLSGAGPAPTDFVLAATSTSAEGAMFEGCGQSGDVP